MTEKNRKKRNRRWLELGVFVLLLGFVIIRYRSYLMDGLREIAGISMAEKLGIFFASAGYMLAEGGIIARMAKVFHVNMRWRTGVGCAYYCSFARTATFGAGGGAAEIYYLSGEGIEPAYGLDLSLIQYLCHKAAVTFAGVISLLLLYPSMEDTAGKYRNYLVLGTVVAVLVIGAILLVLLSKRIAGWLFWLLDLIGGKKESWKKKTDEWKNQVTLGQRGVKTMLQNKKRLAEVFLLDFIKFFCWFSIPYILYHGSGELTLFTSVGRMAVATVMASVIPVPAGYGALEFVQIMLFEPVLGRSRAVSLAILYRVSTTFFPAAIGGVTAFFYKRKGEKLH